jgi:3',5'-cyclic AMP phosphodiesterase CpdA
MGKKVKLLFCFVLIAFGLASQNSSLIILGDIHYDRPEFHDIGWLSTKPDDLRQVTKEYTVYTARYWSDFVAGLKKKVVVYRPPVRAIVQLGDLSEGLAGNEQKAMEMANETMRAIDEVQMPVPWIITKGNHDITGPGAQQAFQKVYIPMFRKQTGNYGIVSANYSYRFQNVQITCLDPWDKHEDIVSFLERELSSTDAKFKFVAIHEPVIPVTERCWHVLRNDPVKRGKLLEVIARHKAIVLCAHLHRYSVICRGTPSGPVVQVMVNSVIRDRNELKPSKLITTYGPSLAENVPGWEPATLETRKAWLAEEAKYVTFYKQTDLPGYAIISADDERETVTLHYYAAFGKKPFDTINLTNLPGNWKGK